jgi:hypothetical protein
MRFVHHRSAAFARISRLIWLVVLALALQPVVSAQQPAAYWVNLSYCSGSATPGQHAAPGTGDAAHGPPHHLWVLLNPAAALNATAAQWALPGAPDAAFPFARPAACAPLSEAPTPRRAQPQLTPQQPRAPPSPS